MTIKNRFNLKSLAQNFNQKQDLHGLDARQSVNEKLPCMFKVEVDARALRLSQEIK